MASAGGGDCEGAAPEADRPHQRPFLIGVSGGTASGKVRGRAARWDLRATSTLGPLRLGADRSSLRPGRTPPAPGCRGASARAGAEAAKAPFPGPGAEGRGAAAVVGQARAGVQAGRGALALGLPPTSPLVSSRAPGCVLPLAASRGPPPRPAPPVSGLLGSPWGLVGQCLQRPAPWQEGQVQAGIVFVYSQSTVCEKIMELLGQHEVDHRQRKLVILSQDRFYKVLTPEQKAKALKGQYNFDHPGAAEDPEGSEGGGQTKGTGSGVGRRCGEIPVVP